MEKWYQNHLDELTLKIIKEFQYLFENFKNQTIYAVAINADNNCVTSYTAISTLESLKKQHNKRKWLPRKWIFTIADGIYADDYLDEFTKKILNFYGDNILPKIQAGSIREQEIENNINFYIQAIKKAKLELINKFGSQVNDIVFVLTVDEQPKITLRSVLEVNDSSILLHEFVDLIRLEPQ